MCRWSSVPFYLEWSSYSPLANSRLCLYGYSFVTNLPTSALFGLTPPRTRRVVFVCWYRRYWAVCLCSGIWSRWSFGGRSKPCEMVVEEVVRRTPVWSWCTLPPLIARRITYSVLLGVEAGCVKTRALIHYWKPLVTHFLGPPVNGTFFFKFSIGKCVGYLFICCDEDTSLNSIPPDIPEIIG